MTLGGHDLSEIVPGFVLIVGSSRFPGANTSIPSTPTLPGPTAAMSDPFCCRYCSGFVPPSPRKRKSLETHGRPQWKTAKYNSTHITIRTPKNAATPCSETAYRNRRRTGNSLLASQELGATHHVGRVCPRSPVELEPLDGHARVFKISSVAAGEIGGEPPRKQVGLTESTHGGVGHSCPEPPRHATGRRSTPSFLVNSNAVLRTGCIMPQDTCLPAHLTTSRQVTLRTQKDCRPTPQPLSNSAD